MSNNTVKTLLVDAHVHIYDCFELDHLLDTALLNFSHAAKTMAIDGDFSGILLLSETSRDNCFARLLAPECDCRWIVEKTQEAAVLKARLKKTVDGESTLFIVAGRQIITAEGLEILALVTNSTFEDGLSVSETLHAIRGRDAIPVFPWSVGKWLGKRGKILSVILQTEAQNELYLGDNSCRPAFWSDLPHFKQAHALNLSILPGSDSLPFREEVSRIGRFGFTVNGQLRMSHLAADLKRLLRKKEVKLLAYGALDNPWRFFINQVLLRKII